jgi:hypothetical protein
VIFFYSFMFIVNLVILNFFLAIVVDAYSDVKGDAANSSNRCVTFAAVRLQHTPTLGVVCTANESP